MKSQTFVLHNVCWTHIKSTHESWDHCSSGLWWLVALFLINTAPIPKSFVPINNFHSLSCPSSFSLLEGRMWRRPSWRQQRGSIRTSKMAVWTWTLLSQESSTNHQRRREAASMPTASRRKRAAAANHRQKLQTHQTDGRTETDMYTEIPSPPGTSIHRLSRVN